MKHKTKNKHKITQHGFTQWIILIILMVGIGVGVWVAQVRTNLAPQAAVVPEIQTTEMSVKLLTPVEINKPFDLGIYVRSDLDSVRLVTAHLKYDPVALELLKIQNAQVSSDSAVIYATASATPNQLPKVTQWLETLFDNKLGNATITGLYGQGDLKTEVGKPDVQFATITMRAKSQTPTTITLEKTSLILRAADNANILTKITDLKLEPQIASKSGAEK